MRRNPGPDEVIVVPHEELVGYRPNRRRESDFVTTDTPLFGRLEPFRVRTAIVRSERYKDQPPVIVRGTEDVLNFLDATPVSGKDAALIIGLSSGGRVRFIYEELQHHWGIARKSLELCLLTDSRAVIIVLLGIQDDRAVARRLIQEFGEHLEHGWPDLLDVLSRSHGAGRQGTRSTAEGTL